MTYQYIRYPTLGGGSAGVTSLNSLTGALNLVAGTGISITPSGSNIIIGNTEAGGTVTSVGLALPSSVFTISGSPVTTSGTLTGSFSSQSANTVFAAPNGSSGIPSFRGLVAADLPAGTGTVTSVSVVSANGLAGTVATPTTTPALTLSTTVTGLLQGNGTAISSYTGGNLTDAGTDGITIGNGTGAVIGTGTTISQHVADTTHNGYLSSADWNTFNSKQTAGNYITALIGDVTASGPGSAVASLTATTNSTITTLSALSLPYSQITGAPAAITALTGDGTASGPGSAALTLATVNSSPGSYTYASLTVNGKGLVTAASSGAAPVTTLSAVGSSPNANAATITGNTLNLQPFSASQPGVVPASGGGTTNFLRADGTWAAAGGGSSNPIQLTQISTPSNPPSGSNDLYFKAVLTPIIITENTTTANTTFSMSATSEWGGQSITAAVTQPLGSITVPLQWTNNSLSGNMFIGVYSDSGGAPGTLIETSSAVNSSTVTSSITNITFTFSGTNTLTSSTVYHFVIQPSSVSFGGAGELVTELNTSDVYAGGNFEDSTNSGGSYTQFPTYDLSFIVSSSNTTSDNGNLYTLNSSGSETRISGSWTPYVLNITASGTSPVLGAIVINNAQYNQVGKILNIVYTLSTSSAGTNGSGTFIFNIPPGFTIDTTRITPGGSTAIYLGICGSSAEAASGAMRLGNVRVYDSTNLALGFQDTTFLDFNSTNFAFFTATSADISFTASVPIV